MKKTIVALVSVIIILTVSILFAYSVDMDRMKAGKPALFSTWGKSYAPPAEIFQNFEGTQAFSATVLEEDFEHMVVRPDSDEPERKYHEKIIIDYPNPHHDYLYGFGRKVVIYYDGKMYTKSTDGECHIATEDISTEGYREFKLSVVPSKTKEKKFVSGKLKDPLRKYSQSSSIIEYDYLLYYYGVSEVNITIENKTMPLRDALSKGKITLDGIIAKCNTDVRNGIIPESSYDDGGSQVYTYPKYFEYKDGGSVAFEYPGYTIIKYHTIDGNRDVYIGTNDMDITVADK